MNPPVFAVTGSKNAGKTTLIRRLIPEFRKNGIAVATIKKSGPQFHFQKENSDTFYHEEAGAVGTVVYGGTRFNLSGTLSKELSEKDFFESFPQADVILVEGFRDSPYPKIEVVRTSVAQQTVSDPKTVIAYVTDDQCDFLSGEVPRISPEEPAAIVKVVLDYLGISNKMGI